MSMRPAPRRTGGKRDDDVDIEGLTPPRSALQHLLVRDDSEEVRELKADLAHVHKQLKDHAEMVRELRVTNRKLKEQLKEQYGVMEMEMKSASSALGALRRDMVELIKERDEYKRLSEENEVDQDTLKGMMKAKVEYGKLYRASQKQLEECEASKM